ncbi:hypothetical protein ACUSIJ_02615 [Pseudochelatococcus sp. B33]
MSAVASERLIVPISSEDKRQVESRARRLGVSTAEYVRRSLQSFDPEAASARGRQEEEERELALLLAALEAARAKTLAQLDRADAALDAALAHFAAKEKGRAA